MYYKKDLDSVITCRISPDLRDDAVCTAAAMGLSLSTFIRQALIRNIRLAHAVEEEMTQRTIRLALGRPE